MIEGISELCAVEIANTRYHDANNSPSSVLAPKVKVVKNLSLTVMPCMKGAVLKKKIYEIYVKKNNFTKWVSH